MSTSTQIASVDDYRKAFENLKADVYYQRFLLRGLDISNAHINLILRAIDHHNPATYEAKHAAEDQS
jgi:hypothetical protein